MEFKENVLDILDIISESNAARRETTKQGKEDYILSKKTKPLKVLIIDNDASKKLVFGLWKSSDRDSLGKIKLDPTPQGYGGSGCYGVWEAVKGTDCLYADVKTVNGVKWSFTETWLSEKGAQKLQNNICPLRSDFADGDAEQFSGWKETRRRKALQHKNKIGKENLENDAKEVKNLNKKMENAYSAPKWDRKEYETLEGKQEKIINKHGEVNLGKNSRQHSKREEVAWQVNKNLDKIAEPLQKYLSNPNKGIKDRAWELNHRQYDIDDMYHQGKPAKEIAAEIDRFKKDINIFLSKVIK